MPLFESLKSLFWQLPLLSDAEKQEIFYYIKWKYGYLEATRDAILEARIADEKIGRKLVISEKGWNCNSEL